MIMRHQGCLIPELFKIVLTLKRIPYPEILGIIMTLGQSLAKQARIQNPFQGKP